MGDPTFRPNGRSAAAFTEGLCGCGDLDAVSGPKPSDGGQKAGSIELLNPPAPQFKVPGAFFSLMPCLHATEESPEAETPRQRGRTQLPRPSSLQGGHKLRAQRSTELKGRQVRARPFLR